MPTTIKPRQLVPLGTICKTFRVSTQAPQRWIVNFAPLGRPLYSEPNPRLKRVYDMNEVQEGRDKCYPPNDELIIDGRKFIWIEAAAKARDTKRASLYYHFVLHVDDAEKEKQQQNQSDDVRTVFIWSDKAGPGRRITQRIYVAAAALKRFDTKWKAAKKYKKWPTARQIEENEGLSFLKEGEELGYEDSVVWKWAHRSCLWLPKGRKLKKVNVLADVNDRGRLMDVEKYSPTDLKTIKKKKDACPEEGVSLDEKGRRWIVRSKIRETWPDIPVFSFPNWYSGDYRKPDWVTLPKRRRAEVVIDGTLRKCWVYLCNDEQEPDKTKRLASLQALADALETDAAAREQRYLSMHTAKSETDGRTLYSFTLAQKRAPGIMALANKPIAALRGKVFYAERVKFPPAGGRSWDGSKKNKSRKARGGGKPGKPRKNADGKQWGYDAAIIDEYAAWKVLNPDVPRINRRGADGRIQPSITKADVALPAKPEQPANVFAGLLLRGEHEHPLIDGKLASRKLRGAERDALLAVLSMMESGMARPQSFELDKDSPTHRRELNKLKRDPEFSAFVTTPDGQKGVGYSVVNVARKS